MLVTLEKHDPEAVSVIARALETFDDNRYTASAILEQIEATPLTTRLDNVIDAASTRVGRSLKGSLCESYHRLRQGGQAPGSDEIAASLGFALIDVPDAATLAYSIMSELDDSVSAGETFTISDDTAANISSSLICYQSG